MSRVKSSRLSRASQSSVTCSSPTRRSRHRRRSCRSASSMASRLLDPGFRPLPALGFRPGDHAPPPHSSSRDPAPARGHRVHSAPPRPKAGPRRSLDSTSAVITAPTAAHQQPPPPSPPRSQAPPIRHAPRCPCFAPPTGAAFKLRPVTALQPLRPASLDNASPLRLAPPRFLDLHSRPTEFLRPAPGPALPFHCFRPHLQGPPPSCYCIPPLVRLSGSTPTSFPAVLFRQAPPSTCPPARLPLLRHASRSLATPLTAA